MKRLTRPFIIILVLVNVVIIICIIVVSVGTLHLKIELKPKPVTIPPKDDTKYILYWLPMWEDKAVPLGSDRYEQFKHCQFNNCFATNDRRWVPMSRFDAIIFHAANYNLMYEKPSTRTPNQRYIFATIKSPISMHTKALQLYNSFYNWTMTYRLDSDIVASYGYVVEKKINYILPDVEFVNNKTHLAALFGSNCDSINKRDDLYNLLVRFIDIDVYGDCSTFKCPVDWTGLKPSAECYDFLAKKYKFFLSFENVYCKDYVSESLYIMLERDIVPVVYGYGDYDYIAPSDSVIIADMFTDVEQLATYLMFLDQHPEQYLKYFEWKKYYYINRNSNRIACKLCQMLNDPLKPQKIYKDIHTWWWGVNRSHCESILELNDAVTTNT